MPRRWWLAAWTLLLVTLASGTLLRIQWTGAVPAWFNSQHLLHAHSHVALLGWAFVAYFGLLFRGSRFARLRWWSLVCELLLLTLIGVLFAAYLYQGYAFWSIVLSTLHILVTLALVWLWVEGPRQHLTAAARPWIDLSAVWLVAATVGPLMLAGGVPMGAVWIDAWVGFYLTLLFNGWLLFGVVGLLVDRFGAGPNPWLRRFMAAGVIPGVLPRFDPWIAFPGLEWIGWAGLLLVGGGLVGVAFRLPLAETAPDGESTFPTLPRRWLAHSVRMAMVLTGVAVVVGGFPPLTDTLAGAHHLVIGFVHLHLLAFVSAALVLLLYRTGWAAAVLFLSGVWGTVAVLLGVGAFELLGRPVFWPVQQVLAAAGVLALTGVALLPLAGLDGRRDQAD